jgi:hypothetical protein
MDVTPPANQSTFDLVGEDVAVCRLADRVIQSVKQIVQSSCGGGVRGEAQIG